MNRADGKYLQGIDGLRAIAILAVVADHAGVPGTPGGFTGVDIFFVISGFLITGQLQTELANTGRIRFLEFYARRIRRLLPALLLVVLVTLPVSYLVLLPQELPPLVKSAKAVLLLVSNHYFYAHSRGYFDTTADGLPLLHMWSLSVEEQFYLVWPLLLFLCGWGGRRSARVAATLGLGAILVLSLAACIYQTPNDHDRSFFLMPFRAWEFSLGGLLAAGAGTRSQPTRFGQLSVNVGLLLLLCAVIFIDSVQDFPGWLALAPCLGAALAIWGLDRGAPGGIGRRFLESAPMRAIGLVSYSWYLWHWPLLVFVRAQSLGQRNLALDFAATLVALLLAVATYRWVENPMRFRRPWLLKTTAGTYAAAGGAMLGMYLVGSVLLSQARVLIKDVEARMGDLERGVGSYAECSLEAKKTGPLEGGPGCVIGRPDAPVRVLLWGDSHADHLIPALEQHHDRDTAILIRLFNGCPPLPGVDLLREGRKDNPRCAEFNKLVATGLESGKYQARGVILSSRWNYYLGLPVTEPGDFKPVRIVPSSANGGNAKPLPEVSRTLSESLHRAFEDLNHSGIRMLLIAPIPEFTYSIPGCLYRHDPSRCTMSRQVVEERRRLFMTAARKAAKDFDNVRIFDPVEHFCDREHCYAALAGKTLYRDSNHLSIHGASYLLRLMDSSLSWLAQGPPPLKAR